MARINGESVLKAESYLRVHVITKIKWLPGLARQRNPGSTKLLSLMGGACFL